MNTSVEFKNVDIIFGDKTDAALAMLDAGQSRADILAATGSVLGAAGASLVVKQGEISVLMGLSGSGKSTLFRSGNFRGSIPSLHTKLKSAVRHDGIDIDDSLWIPKEIEL